MITFIRKLFESKLGAILAIAFVAVIGLAFALSDVSGSLSPSGVGGGTAAKVGSHDITEAELSDAMDTAFRQVQRDNPGLTMAAFVEQGGLDDVFASLIDRVTVGAYAEKHGMAVSKAMVDAEIRDVPAFKGLDGAFSREAFQTALRQNDVTEEQFREDVRRSLYLEQLLSVAGTGTKAADNMALPYASLILEERKGQLGIVPSEAFVPKRAPTDKELAAFYQSNRAGFTVPERRAIRYAVFGRDSMAGKVQVSDAEVAKYYRDNQADYAASEERTISQVIVPTEAAAKAVAQRAAKGESLSAIAGDIGVAVSTAENVTRTGYASQTSDAVAQAAFGAAIGSVAAPARGDLGWYVARADSGRSIAAKPLAAVSGDIRKTLTAERAQEAVDELTGEIEDRLADGATLAEIARTVGAQVKTTPALFQQGGSPDAPQFQLPGELAPIREAAFQMEADGEPQLIQLGEDQRFAVVGIAKVEAAAPPPLAKIRAQAVTAWKRSEAAKAARALAAKVRDSVNKSTTLKQALIANNAPLKQVQDISGTRQQLTQNQGQVPPPLQLLFSMAQGSTKLLPAPQNQGFFVVHLDKLVRHSAKDNKPLLSATSQQLSQALSQEFSAGFIAAMRENLGVKRNQAVIDRLRARLTGLGN
ncbi:SurA N-terminal domain-containing protein [Novosphingopyxis sp.]|uniref:peptidylprolyl isomerase n=1 Tax=Novosphingopyxis sp. TaxID=2709690 RepID=UPI003B58D339